MVNPNTSSHIIEVGIMDDQDHRPRYSARITFQVSPEVRDRLLAMADEQYGGDRQALGRAALEGWLQREDTRRSDTARILETLYHLREEVARKKDTSNILKNIDFVREDVASGEEIDEILETVKKIREDVLVWNRLIAGVLERLGVKSQP